MKYGWRWITPTWSRIGTGYVFSSKYISVDEAIREFQEDLGDDSVVPNVIDFSPKAVETTMFKNYCSLGMASGFLEPLDAPGLTISSASTFLLNDLFKEESDNIKHGIYNLDKIQAHNRVLSELGEGLKMFIFSQYKTCHRTDTEFWRDYKNVYYDRYEELIDSLNNKPKKLKFIHDSYQDTIQSHLDVVHMEIKTMVMFTLASRNINWKSCTNKPPKPLKEIPGKYKYVNHFDYINKIYEKVQQGI
jgi:hypothetical protein